MLAHLQHHLQDPQLGGEQIRSHLGGKLTCCAEWRMMLSIANIECGQNPLWCRWEFSSGYRIAPWSLRWRVLPIHTFRNK
jgi:hypothetical protein